MKNKVYSKFNQIPFGMAADQITEGCIVLEGGAFRGLYTAGVLDALMYSDINMQCTIGVSAGAMNGLNYVAGQIGRSARVNLKYRHDWRYVGVKALRTNKGVIGFDFLFDEIENEEPLQRKRFFNEKRRFVVVTTNCKNGKPEYMEKGKGDIFQAVRASASMPYVSRMVDIEGIPYLDGGCSDKIPYQWAIDQGYKKIIIVRTREAAFRKNMDTSKNELAAHKVYRSYPEFADVLGKSDVRYNAQCDEIEKLHQEKKVFAIVPSVPVQISRLERNMEKLGDLYWLGYHDALNQLSELRTYLSVENNMRVLRND